jgi:hydroxyacylglutathione hydrolase
MNKGLVKTCVVGSFQENTYFLDNGKNSLLIDPGADPEKIWNTFFEGGHSPLHSILATHGHFDHVGGVEFFKNKFDVPFGMNLKDKRILSQANLYRKISGESEYYPTPQIDFELGNTESVHLGGFDLNVYQTPGHSDGSVIIEWDRMLICGDVILENQVGRTDLPGGNKIKLIDSVKFIVDRFIGYRIFPGHGPDFILDEKKADYFLSLL